MHSMYLGSKQKLEFIGGYGYGSKKFYRDYACDCGLLGVHNLSEEIADFNNRFHRIFGQLNFVGFTGKKAESRSAFLLSFRFASLLYTKYLLFYEYYNLDQSYFTPVRKDYAQLRNKMVFSLEPAIGIRFGIRPVHFTLQAVPVFFFGDSIIKKYAFDTRSSASLYFRLGLNYALVRKNK